MATYYMRADGTAANKAAATGPGSSQSACMNVSVHNGETFAVGDVIRLADDGGVYRAQLTIPSSGSSGNPITYEPEVGDTPVISGADVMSGFTLSTTERFSDDFESGDTSAWDGNTGTAPTATTASVKNGTYGMEVDTTGATFSLKNHTFNASGQDEVYAEFWMKLNDLQDDGSDQSYIFRLDDTIGAGNQVVQVFVESISSTKQIWTRHRDNAGFNVNTKFAIDGGWHLISVYYKAHASAGIHRFYIDGELKTEATGLTNNNFDTMDFIYLGNGPDGSPNWTKFNAYFDDFFIGNQQRSVYEAASVTTAPNHVFEDNALLTQAGAADGCINAGTWFHDSSANKLYVHSSDDADPDTHTIEAGQRDIAIHISGKEYLTFTGITAERSNGNNKGNFFFQFGVTNLTVQNCVTREAFHDGIMFLSDVTDPQNTLIDNNNIHDNGRNGIFADRVGGSSGNETTISNNNIYGNGFFGVRCAANYWIIEKNKVYNNSIGQAAVGIILNDINTGNQHAQNCIVRYNQVYSNGGSGNDGSGITLDIDSKTSEVYYNIVYNNWGAGIDIYSAEDANVYNNAVYANLTGPPIANLGEIRILEDGTNECVNIVLKNNIGYATGSGVYAIYVDDKAFDSSGLDIDYNLWYRTSGDWWFWDSGGGTSLVTWKGKTGVGSSELNADPLFVNAAANDFHIQSGSPCRDAGTPVGLTQDFWGNPVPK